MKPLILCLLVVTLLTGCNGDDDFPGLRSSASVATEDMQLYIAVEAHEAFDDEAAHSHINVELYTDEGNFYRYIELTGDDRLSVSAEGVSTAIEGQRFPPHDDAMYVDYHSELEANAPGTELLVTVERSASDHSTSVLMPEETAITLMPESDWSVSDNIIVDWVEETDAGYRLRFIFNCTNAEGDAVEHTVPFPNHSVPELEPPFTFAVADYYHPPAEPAITACDLTLRLQTLRQPAAPSVTDFAAVGIQTLRSQSVTRPLAIE